MPALSESPSAPLAALAVVWSAATMTRLVQSSVAGFVGRTDGNSGGGRMRSCTRASSKYRAFFARIGGVPATLPLSSAGVSCMILHLVSSGRAVSCREDLSHPRQGARACPGHVWDYLNPVA